MCLSDALCGVKVLEITGCRNSYRFITIYDKSTYEFICLESHVNNEINLDLRVSNIPGYSAVEG